MKGLIFWMVVYFIKLFKVIISSKTFIHPIYFLFEEPIHFILHTCLKLLYVVLIIFRNTESLVWMCVCVYYNTVLQVCLISSAVKTDKRQLNKHNLVFPNISLHSVIWRSWANEFFHMSLPQQYTSRKISIFTNKWQKIHSVRHTAVARAFNTLQACLHVCMEHTAACYLCACSQYRVYKCCWTHTCTLRQWRQPWWLNTTRWVTSLISSQTSLASKSYNVTSDLWKGYAWGTYKPETDTFVTIM